MGMRISEWPSMMTACWWRACAGSAVAPDIMSGSPFAQRTAMRLASGTVSVRYWGLMVAPPPRGVNRRCPYGQGTRSAMQNPPSIPALTAQQMATIDRIMVEDFGVETMQLMEVAGRAVAAFARDQLLGGDVRGKRIIVLCGSGGNGGDGMVAARFLHAWG
ncbi:MAG: hypothetical protein C4346_09050, partial [Chloroflexota bacterium]